MIHKIKKVVFINSFTGPSAVKRLNPLPTVAMIGRSNVGKSTFINAITESKSIAKTGKTPGKTRLINYFMVNDRYYFVDLPGYGYAKLSKPERKMLADMVYGFLTAAPGLKLITQLIDIRIGATDLDIEFFNMMYQTQIPILLVANKSDKISKNIIGESLKKISNRLEIDILPTPHSSVKKEQTEHIRSMIMEQLDNGKPDLKQPDDGKLDHGTTR